MIRIDLAFIVFIFLVLVSPISQAADCDEHNGIGFAQLGDLDTAFEMLQGCERLEKVSADTLVQLAKLYGSLDYSDFSEEDAMKKVWILMHRAAELGHPDALDPVIRLYTHGEPSISVRPNEKKKLCLERIKSSGKTDRGAFRSCMVK